MTASYQVEIRIKPGISRVDAIGKMVELFHVSSDKLEHAFSNNDSVFKHGLDIDTAKKYQLALESCGCICLIEPDSQVIQNVQEISPHTSPRNPMVGYPKIYLPMTMFKVLFGLIAFTAISVISLVVLKHTPSYTATSDLLILKVLPVILSLLLVSILGYQTIGYSVTLMPDSITVKTLLGAKIIQKKDIESYRIVLAKTTTLFLKTHRNKSIAIPVTFMRDDGFNDWFKTIPNSNLSLGNLDEKLATMFSSLSVSLSFFQWLFVLTCSMVLPYLLRKSLVVDNLIMSSLWWAWVGFFFSSLLVVGYNISSSDK